MQECIKLRPRPMSCYMEKVVMDQSASSINSGTQLSHPFQNPISPEIYATLALKFHPPAGNVVWKCAHVSVPDESAFSVEYS